MRDRLIGAAVALEFHEEILRSVPDRAIGVVLYGSVARGDASGASDIDLLVIADLHDKNRAVGRTNVTTYDEDQFRSAAGTLYGMHIARDGVVLHDSGSVEKDISNFGEVDVERVEGRLAQLAMLLEFPDTELRSNLQGYSRHARYVLRTATYLAALKDGKPCFSVSELADLNGDPSLVALLSSHLPVQGEATWDSFLELRRRSRKLVQPEAAMEYDSLSDAIVGFIHTRPDLADAGILLLERSSTDPYAAIPRVIL